MRRVRKIIYKIMLLLFVGLVAGLGYLGYKIHQNVETVMTFEKQVEAEVKKNKIPEYKTLALAIIYTESKGKSGDIMQSSESVYGQQEVQKKLAVMSGQAYKHIIMDWIIFSLLKNAAGNTRQS